MNRRGFLTALLGVGLATLFGWKPKYTPFAWEAEPAWSGLRASVVNDYDYFLIVDRVGMNVTYVDRLPLTYRPGDSGLVRYWRRKGGKA